MHIVVKKRQRFPPAFNMRTDIASGKTGTAAAQKAGIPAFPHSYKKHATL
jgi:hypothetical protein